MDMQRFDTPGDGPQPTMSPSADEPRWPVLVFAWAAVLALLGGIACGHVSVQYGLFGSVGLWALGALGGYVARKITIAPYRSGAWALVGACVVAYVVSEVCWIRWSTEQGEESWAKAIEMLPTYFSEYTLSAALGVLFAVFGAQSAFWQAGKRYRYVAIVEE